MTATRFERTVIWLLVRIYRAVTKANPLPPEESEDDKLMEAWAKGDPDEFWPRYMEKRRKS